jgi:hypothetical protein
MALLSSPSKLSRSEVAVDSTFPRRERMRKLIGSVLMVVSLVLVAGAAAQEEKVALDKVPAPVLAAVKKRFPNGDMKGAKKEIENGKTVYEITLKDKGLSVDVSSTPEGALLTIEREIALKDVPEVVRKAFAAKSPNAKLEMIEEVIKVEGEKETLQYYEFHLPGDTEICVLPDGKLREEAAPAKK